MAEQSYLRSVPSPQKKNGGGDGIDAEKVEHRLTALETRLGACRAFPASASARVA